MHPKREIYSSRRMGIWDRGTGCCFADDMLLSVSELKSLLACTCFQLRKHQECLENTFSYQKNAAKYSEEKSN
jgi:hypothetical protein